MNRKVRIVTTAAGALAFAYGIRNGKHNRAKNPPTERAKLSPISGVQTRPLTTDRAKSLFDSPPTPHVRRRDRTLRR